MATSTTNYSFTLPEVGGDTDQWGTQLNNNWTSLDSTLKTVADSVGDDVTLTGNDFLTISGQAITVGDVDLTADVTGTLPVESGGTGLAALGSANQVLAVNSTADGLEFQTISGSGTVTSVAVTGSDGIEIDSGSPISSSGTIALGINSTTLSTHLGLGSLATQSTITESQISDLGSYITASSTDTLINKSGNISQWTNDSGYLTAETNDLSNVSGTLAIANGGTGQTTAATARVALLPTLATNGSKLVAVNSGATDIEYIATSTLSITESQISDLQSYLTSETNDLSASVTWVNVPDANVTQSSVTQHQAALSITESQISDFGSYQPADQALTDISGLAVTDGNIIVGHGTTWVAESGATARTSLGLTIGTDVEAYSSTNADYSDATANFTGTLQNGGSNVLVTSDIGSAVQGYDADTTKNDVANTFTATQIISVTDNTNAALRVTQLGTGNALVVEDSANPDSTPFVVTSDGRVGIGTSSPSALMHTTGSSIGFKHTNGSVTLQLFSDGTNLNTIGDGPHFLGTDNANPTIFKTNNTERMRIDSGGNVGIGTSPSAPLDVKAGTDQRFMVRELGTGAVVLDAVNAANSAYQTLITNGSEHILRTGASERMRIDSSGNVKINNLSASSDVQTDASKNLITTSDARLKNDLGVITDSAINVVQQIIPKYFSWKNDESNTQQLGFFAQDIYPVLPEAAPRALKYTEVGRDKNDEPILEQVFDVDGDPDYEWGFTDRPIIAMCVKAIQEQQALIESQQSQIDALTARIDALETLN